MEIRETNKMAQIQDSGFIDKICAKIKQNKRLAMLIVLICIMLILIIVIIATSTRQRCDSTELLPEREPIIVSTYDNRITVMFNGYFQFQEATNRKQYFPLQLKSVEWESIAASMDLVTLYFDCGKGELSVSNNRYYEIRFTLYEMRGTVECYILRYEILTEYNECYMDMRGDKYYGTLILPAFRLEYLDFNVPAR